MTRFEVGDIVRVPVPHVERARLTVRPALVVGHRDSAVGLLLWALMITSGQRPAWPGDLDIPDAEQRGLLIPCKVRTSKIFTVMATQARPLGRLDPHTLLAVRDQVRAAVEPLLTE